MDDPQGHSENRPGSQPPQSYSQDFKHTPIAARVPEKVSRGVFSTATMILQTPHEFVIDFVSTMNQPQQVVGRVVLTPATFSQFVAALRMNIGRYEQEFGPLAPSPSAAVTMTSTAGPPGPAPQVEAGQAVLQPASIHTGPGAGSVPPSAPSRPSIEELYEQWKLPDDLMGGVFANAVMIRHTPYEFCFDFIANFYPRSVVTARVYVAAARILALLDAMSNAWQKFQQMIRGMSPPGAPPAPGA